MIELSDINGRRIYLHQDAIAIITEAQASSQWHGIRSFVKTFDGKIIEARETANYIAAMLAAAPKPEDKTE